MTLSSTSLSSLSKLSAMKVRNLLLLLLLSNGFSEFLTIRSFFYSFFSSFLCLILLDFDFIEGFGLIFVSQ